MPVMNSASYPKQTDRRIMDMVKSQFALQEREYLPFVTSGEAPVGREYRAAKIAGVNLMRQMPEGAGVEFDTIVEGEEVAFIYNKYGGGFQITEEMEQDQLHFSDVLDVATKTLAASAAFRQDLDFWSYFAYGDAINAARPNVKAWDSLSLFNNSHTRLKTGATYSNYGTSDLLDTSLQAAFEKAFNGDFNVSEEGFPEKQSNFDCLIVCSENTFKAQQLMMQAFGVVGSSPFANAAQGSSTAVAPNAAQAANILNPKSGYVPPYKVVTSQVLGQLMTARGGNYTGSWALGSTKDMGFKVLNKITFKMENYRDDNSHSRVFQGRMRYLIMPGPFATRRVLMNFTA